MSSHLDGTGFIFKSKCNSPVHIAILHRKKKGGDNQRVSNFTLQKNRMENVRLGRMEDRADCNGLIGVHGQGTGDQEQPRHDNRSKNA